MSIIDLLKEESSKSDDKMYGLTLGIVTNTEDPENLGRVKVQLLLRDASDNETDWIRVAVPFAGNKMGAYFIPDVDDEVLVGFINGDIHKPFVMAGLWNTKNKPPVDNEKGKNLTKMIKTKSGIEVILEDSENGEESVVDIKTPKGLHVTMKDKDEVVEVSDKGGKNGVKIDAKGGQINVNAEKKIMVKTGGSQIILDGAGQKIDIKTTTLSIKAAKIDINADASMTVKSGGLMNVEASGSANIKGAIVKIN
ncbi:phage baseplate assembly protein V [Fusibacter sp. JL216-2]|uniref:phage baseplate assembly protein V n=1 Tax=Fusibacter sp. JL216-2 TaxID=3071453 RepID=UPI003D353185